LQQLHVDKPVSLLGYTVYELLDGRGTEWAAEKTRISRPLLPALDGMSIEARNSFIINWYNHGLKHTLATRFENTHPSVVNNLLTKIYRQKGGGLYAAFTCRWHLHALTR